MQTIKVSENFKKMTIKAIRAIILFIATYILLIILAVALTALCCFLAVVLITAKFNSWTVMLALGLVSMGLLTLIFLVKFIFKKHVTDVSDLTEISKEQEPMLFQMIEEIVIEVQTDFPKKVYLSENVNASVFYDSSFWSMFLPVKKNIQIGVGLINTVSVTELKAILAHEFGHFSQRTMKVGSYVYNMNQIIYNMLYDNESYDNLTRKWGSGGSIITIFVSLAAKIVTGIQWILKKVYEILNLSYMSLSREMEFHADEVAANVTGTRPLIASLLRMELADHSYNTVINYYSGKVKDSVTAGNIYPQQEYVMNFLAEKNKLPIKDNLPQVNLEHLSRYNKSKLVITNQWASHPSTKDRIDKLEKLNLDKEDYNTDPASILFKDMAATQQKLTERLFSSVQYAAPVVVKSQEEFIGDFLAEHEENSFHDLYNSYYDNKNPFKPDDQNITIPISPATPDLNTLFSDEAVDAVYTSVSLEDDIRSLNQISEGTYPINSFDYDGIKYTPEDCPKLIAELDKKLLEVKNDIAVNDANIYAYFIQLAENHGKNDKLDRYYQSFSDIEKRFEIQFGVYLEMIQKSGFIFENTPFDVISENLKLLKEIEINFKEEVKKILEEEIFQASLTEDIRTNFNDYVSKNYVFFYDQAYKSEELNILVNSINDYRTVISKTHFLTKKRLLDYQISLAAV